MIEVAALLISLASLILASAVLYMTISVIPLVKEYLIIWKSKTSTIVERHIGSNLTSATMPIQNVLPENHFRKVADIPPEVLAPALKNPPKVAGGFGKKVDE